MTFTVTLSRYDGGQFHLRLVGGDDLRLNFSIRIANGELEILDVVHSTNHPATMVGRFVANGRKGGINYFRMSNC